MKKIAVLLLFLFVYSSTSYCAGNILFSRYKVKLLSAPSFAGNYISQFGRLTRFEIVEDRGEWFKVIGPNGEQGFLAKKWLLEKEEAIKEIDKAKQTKLIADKNRQIEVAEIKNKLIKIPESNYKENLGLYQRLLSLDKENNIYKEKISYYVDKIIEREKSLRAGYDLEIISWQWAERSGYVVAEGEVKNISSLKMKGVLALVVWYDSNDRMITYSDSVVEYNPIMPDQTAPFRVNAKYNPLMDSAKLIFKTISGATLPAYLSK